MGAFLDTIAEQVRTILFEREADMLHAWHENIEEATASEEKFPPLKLSIAATVDLEAAKVESSLTFTTRYKSTVSGALPDPNQPPLPGLDARAEGKERAMGKNLAKQLTKALKPGESITIESGGKSATIRK